VSANRTAREEDAASVYGYTGTPLANRAGRSGHGPWCWVYAHVAAALVDGRIHFKARAGPGRARTHSERHAIIASTRTMTPRFPSLMASYDVASKVWQALVEGGRRARHRGGGRRARVSASGLIHSFIYCTREEGVRVWDLGLQRRLNYLRMTSMSDLSMNSVTSSSTRKA